MTHRKPTREYRKRLKGTCVLRNYTTLEQQHLVCVVYTNPFCYMLGRCWKESFHVTCCYHVLHARVSVTSVLP